MVESTMGVDDPPPDPPETGEQIVAQCLDDLRRAEFSILPSAISRIDGQPLVFQPGVRQSPASTQHGVQPHVSAPLLSNSVQEESRHGDRIFSPASQHGMETVPAWQLLFASQTQLPATLVGSTLQQARAPSQHTSPVVDGGVSGAAASHSAGGVSVPLALPQFGPPQSLQQGVPRHALNSGLNGGQMLSQQTGGAHVVGGFMQASQQTTTTPFPHNVAIVVHGANGLNNSPNQAHVIGGDIQGPNGDGVQLQRITLPANVQGNVLPSVVHANMEKTLPSVVHDGGTAVTHGNVSLLNNATIGHSLPPIAPNASNPSALHELNSLHNANTPIMNTPTVALGNDISLNNANANLPNVTVPIVALGSNLSLNNANLPSVAVGGTMAHSLTNPNIAKNVPSATVGVIGPEQPLLPAPRDPPPPGSEGGGGVPQVGVGVGTSTNPLLGSQPVAPIHISTCNTFTLLQDVNETVLAEGAHTQEVVHDTTLANQAHTQEATTKDFDADLDDHLAKVLDQEEAHNEDAYSSPTQVEDNSTHGDASSAAPTSLGLQTPVREHGIGLEASDDDDDNNSSVAGRVAIFESAGRNREFAGGPWLAPLDF
nr:hypothetical protein Iba_chr04aCG15610 [Ipomoea batatas]